MNTSIQNILLAMSGQAAGQDVPINGNGEDFAGLLAALMSSGHSAEVGAVVRTQENTPLSPIIPSVVTADLPSVTNETGAAGAADVELLASLTSPDTGVTVPAQLVVRNADGSTVTIPVTITLVESAPVTSGETAGTQLSRLLVTIAEPSREGEGTESQQEGTPVSEGSAAVSKSTVDTSPDDTSSAEIAALPVAIINWPVGIPVPVIAANEHTADDEIRIIPDAPIYSATDGQNETALSIDAPIPQSSANATVARQWPLSPMTSSEASETVPAEVAPADVVSTAADVSVPAPTSGNVEVKASIDVSTAAVRSDSGVESPQTAAEKPETMTFRVVRAVVQDSGDVRIVESNTADSEVEIPEAAPNAKVVFVLKGARSGAGIEIAPNRETGGNDALMSLLNKLADGNGEIEAVFVTAPDTIPEQQQSPEAPQTRMSVAGTPVTDYEVADYKVSDSPVSPLEKQDVTMAVQPEAGSSDNDKSPQVTSMKAGNYTPPADTAADVSRTRHDGNTVPLPANNGIEGKDAQVRTEPQRAEKAAVKSADTAVKQTISQNVSVNPAFEETSSAISGEKAEEMTAPSLRTDLSSRTTVTRGTADVPEDSLPNDTGKTFVAGRYIKTVSDISPKIATAGKSASPSARTSPSIIETSPAETDTQPAISDGENTPETDTTESPQIRKVSVSDTAVRQTISRSDATVRQAVVSGKEPDTSPDTTSSRVTGAERTTGHVSSSAAPARTASSPVANIESADDVPNGVVRTVSTTIDTTVQSDSPSTGEMTDVPDDAAPVMNTVRETTIRKSEMPEARPAAKAAVTASASEPVILDSQYWRNNVRIQSADQEANPKAGITPEVTRHSEAVSDIHTSEADPKINVKYEAVAETTDTIEPKGYESDAPQSTRSSRSQEIKSSTTLPVDAGKQNAASKPSDAGVPVTQTGSDTAAANFRTGTAQPTADAMKMPEVAVFKIPLDKTTPQNKAHYTSDGMTAGETLPPAEETSVESGDTILPDNRTASNTFKGSVSVQSGGMKTASAAPSQTSNSQTSERNAVFDKSAIKTADAVKHGGNQATTKDADPEMQMSDGKFAAYVASQAQPVKEISHRHHSHHASETASSTDSGDASPVVTVNSVSGTNTGASLGNGTANDTFGNANMFGASGTIARNESAPESSSDDTQTIFGIKQSTETSPEAVTMKNTQPAAQSSGNYDDISNRTVDTIVRNAVLMSKNGQSSAVIRLEPPSLGKVKLEIVTERSKVTGKITVETQEAKQIIENRMSELRQNLSQNGLTVESFDVQVGHNGSGDALAQRETFEQLRMISNMSRSSGLKVTNTETVAGTAGTPVRNIRHNGALDVWI